MTKITRIYCPLLLFILMSCFMSNSVYSMDSTYSMDDIQRIRIDFKMPNGFIRHLLLGFTPDNRATDGYDYGYDALNIDTFPDDLNWMIEDMRYVIQTVGAFDDSKKYPLGMFLAQGGDIEIYVDAMGNFDVPVNVYVHDALLNTYTHINDSKYAANIESGEYRDRFYIAFKSDANENVAKNALSTQEAEIATTSIKFLSNTKELYVQTKSEIKEIIAYNIQGQKLVSFNSFNNNSTKIPLSNLNIKNHVIVTVKTDIGLTTRQLFITP